MAEDAAPRDPALRDPALRDPAERGSLHIADRVIERVATIAAAEVAGVARTGSGIERAVGRQYPRAQAHTAGKRVRIDVEIAVAWPSSLPEVAGAVRRGVTEKVGSLVGLQVDAVDVSAAKVVRAAPANTRRVQ